MPGPSPHSLHEHDVEYMKKLVEGLFAVSHQWMDENVTFDCKKGLEEKVLTLREIGLSDEEIVRMILEVLPEKVKSAIDAIKKPTK